MSNNSSGELFYWHCPLESDTRGLAQSLATGLVNWYKGAAKGHAASIWLQGDLGAGKTTLVREMLKALGVEGRIKSPTYALIEEYKSSLLEGLGLIHLDLYRLSAAEELEYIGVPEILASSLTLVEWPEQGNGWLPKPDLIIKIEDRPGGRMFMLNAETEIGTKIID